MPELPEGTLLFFALVGVALGLLGSVLPGLPGVPLIFVSAFVYAYLTGFEVVGGGVIVLIGALAVLAFVADYVGTAYGARRFGASGWGTAGGAIGGLLGALVGALFLGIGAIFGLILGSIAGVCAGEHLRRSRGDPADDEAGNPLPRPSDWRRTSRAAGGVLVGYVISAVAQGVMGIIAVIAFVLAVIY